MALVLAIETSCDETGVAVVRSSSGQVKVLSQALASQIETHAATSGVVPEVAAREHVLALRPLVAQVLAEAEVKIGKLDAIAVTVGPGLMPALAVGVNAARALSWATGVPVVPVNHLEGHIYSALLEPVAQHYQLPPETTFSAVALVVSGGHTLFVKMDSHLEYQIVGSTIDDAVGEAFDKVARVLGLGYPGGPLIAQLAEEGEPTRYDFPRPLAHDRGANVSFSGLKTAVWYAVRDRVLSKQDKADVAASFQAAVMDVLIQKTLFVLETHCPRTLLLAGGVAANLHLRQATAKIAQQMGVKLQVAPPALCGDNGVMIGQAGAVAFEAGRVLDSMRFDASARLSLEQPLV